MPFLAQTLDNIDPLFALVVTQDVYVQQIKVADLDAACGSLYKQII